MEEINSIHSSNLPSQPDYRGFEINWENINYTVVRSKIDLIIASLQGEKNTFANREKWILNGVSGHLKSGQLTGIMGSSGAGKSVLLEVISGLRVRGKTGAIRTNSDKNLDVVFIPQKDEFYSSLTVRECMLFSSKLKNGLSIKSSKKNQVWAQEKGISSITKEFHSKNVENILQKLGLESCADTKISKISGGQSRRLAVGQELTRRPDVFILDEPTTGLDSSACEQVVNLLYDLTQDAKPVAIVATIHQPSYRVFCRFHKIYVLSKIGTCIYEGSPEYVQEYISTLNIPLINFKNPADSIIEIAGGNYGVEVYEDMQRVHEDLYLQRTNLMANLENYVELKKQLRVPKFDRSKHFTYLFQRTTLTIVRNRWLFGIRVASHILTGVLIILLAGTDVGYSGGCPPQLPEEFEAEELDRIQKEVAIQKIITVNNIGATFFSFLFITMASQMTTILTFPIEMNIFMKEKTNQWYDVWTFYLSKSVAELPFTIFFPLMYSSIIYFGTGQPLEYWRYLVIMLNAIFLSINAQGVGMLVGSIFMKNLTAATFVGPLAVIPFFIFAGFIIRISNIPNYYAPFIYSSYVKFAFETSILTTYGYERCGQTQDHFLGRVADFKTWLGIMFNAHEGNTNSSSNSEFEGTVSHSFINNIVNSIIGVFISQTNGEVQSSIVNYYELIDSMLLNNILFILIFAVTVRSLVYYVIAKKASAKQ